MDDKSVPIKLSLAEIPSDMRSKLLRSLAGGQKVVAAKELDAFNQIGTNASYYFANAAWALYHHKTDESRDWLVRAGYIYAPAKFKLYADSMKGLGNPH